MKKLIKKLINKRVIIFCKNNAFFEGDLLSVDEEINCLLDDAEEFCENGNRNFLGLMILKGDFIRNVEIKFEKMNLNI